MSDFVSTGDFVVPGEVLYHSCTSTRIHDETEVMPGEGCQLRFSSVVVKTAGGGGGGDRCTSAKKSSENGPKKKSRSAATGENSISSNETVQFGVNREIISTRLGIAQWDGSVVSVYSSPPRHRISTAPSVPTEVGENRKSTATLAALPVSPSTSSILTRATTTVFGPRPHDRVHLRVTRVTRSLSIGEIIAVNDQWCRHNTNTGGGAGAAFRGVLRIEDTRPFRPTKEVLHPPPPSASFAPGDVVLAIVISQSDVRQYQLSTLDEKYGVVQSVIRDADGQRIALEHIPGRRDAMRHPKTNAIFSRWCPLIPL